MGSFLSSTSNKPPKQRKNKKKEHSQNYNPNLNNNNNNNNEVEEKVITLSEIRVMQAKILELVSAEQFQKDLCDQITEELHSYMEKNSVVVTNRLTHIIEADLANVEMRIVNSVIANVTQHVVGRLEGKIAAMEERLVLLTAQAAAAQAAAAQAAAAAEAAQAAPERITQFKEKKE